MNENLKDWVKRWQNVGPKLEAIRQAELKTVITPEAIESFDLLFRESIAKHPLSSTSGLVEQQRLFSKLRKHERSS